jgi:DNA polymerase-3 subunit gamma/tau
VEHLQLICSKESIDAHKAGLQLIARQAAGGMRDALSLLDQVISFAGTTINEEQVTQILGVANRKHLFALSESVLTRNTDGALNALDDVHRYGYDLSQFVKELVHHFRDLTVTKAVKNPERVTDLTQTELAQVQQIIADVPEDLLHRCFQVVVQGAQEMSKSSYPKLIFEMTLVRMCQLEPLIGLDLLVEKLQDLEELLEDEGEKKKIKSLSATPSSASKTSTVQELASAPVQAPAPVEPVTVPTHTPSVQRVEPATLEPKPAPSYPPSFADVPSPFEPLADTPPTPEASTPPRREESTREPEPPAWTREEIPPAQAPATQGLTQTPAAPIKPAQEPVETTDESGVHIDFQQMTPVQAWKIVVKDIRRETAPLAATLEHAYVEAFTQHTLHLTFTETYYHFVHDDTRRPQVNAHLKRLFGEHFEVVIELRTSSNEQEHAESQGGNTLAQQRDIANAKRHSDLVEAIQTHAAVVEARLLFEPSNETIRVDLND